MPGPSRLRAVPEESDLEVQLMNLLPFLGGFIKIRTDHPSVFLRPG